jgi:hypothetical protein
MRRRRIRASYRWPSSKGHGSATALGGKRKRAQRRPEDQLAALWAREGQFAEWVASVHEQASVLCRDRSDPTERQLTGPWVAAIKRADSHGEDQVVRLFAGFQSEVFGRDVANAHAP